jgi:hypothetical protein
VNALTEKVCDHERLINAHREVVGLIASIPDFEQAATQIAELLANTLGADGASVTQVVGGHYRYVAAVGSAELAAGTSRPLEGSFTGSVIADRTTRLFRLDNVRRLMAFVPMSLHPWSWTTA